jgi:hypothetical protein
MFIYSRPSGRHVKKPVSQAAAKLMKSEAWLLKIGQTIFVGITVIGFILLFQGK